jgi:peptidoglycan/xylan/chitin deacetylase (PgdA/CDA1 family)
MKQSLHIAILLFFALQQFSIVMAQGKADAWIIDLHGAIRRGDLAHKEIALVFAGHEFADGGEVILNTLKNHNAQASFFLSGKFYTNPEFKTLIQKMTRAGHYMGAHSDQYLRYTDVVNRDSTLITHDAFKHDLHNNFKHMSAFGIKKDDALFFLPPHDTYNSTIASWTQDYGLHLINGSPGTLSGADNTVPGTEGYKTADEIFQSILNFESHERHGLNGFILLFNIGTDPKRTDKFYNMLDALLEKLEHKGYSFLEIQELLE